jgi:hypothetical protein
VGGTLVETLAMLLLANAIVWFAILGVSVT